MRHAFTPQARFAPAPIRAPAPPPVNGAIPLDPDLAYALDGAQIGVGVVDAALRVVERRGPLAQWLPEAGEICCACPLLFAMEEAFEALKQNGGAPLILPSVGQPGLAEARANVSIAWNARTAHFVIVTAPDDGTRQLDLLLLRERREKQLLQQQAAAAADRSRISATLYRDIVESTGDAVLRLNPDLTVAFVNGAACALLGVEADAIRGRAIQTILPLPAADNPWRATMCANGAASFDQLAHNAVGASAWLWWDVRWLGEDGGPSEFQAVGRDVTQIRRLQAELEKANEDAKFAALAQERLRIAHDLHDTLVRSIVNLQARLSLLRRASPDGPLKDDLVAAETEAREGLREARSAVSQMRRDTDWPAGPGPALTEAAQNLRQRAGVAVALEIDEALAGAPPPVAAAMARVGREALRNVGLHSGARNVAIAATARPDAFELHIADDGVGFDPSAERSGHYGLVGMYEQGQLVGGSLRIDSAPGQGARLTLSIPRR